MTVSDLFRSPNHAPRDPGTVVDTLVLHYTGMKTAEEALERLCTPGTDVSAHYFVQETGEVLHLVPEDRRAWHAGVSSWRGHTDTNNRSIGVEIVNPGHEWGYRPFPERQIRAVTDLCVELLQRHPIEPRRIVGHSDVAPWRKEDPGELFDWRGLAEAGVGLWPDDDVVAAASPEGDAGRLLEEIGYRVDGPSSTEKALTAFQRRYRPMQMTGRADAASMKMINAVVELFRLNASA